MQRFVLTALAAAAVHLTLPANAAPATPDQARALEAQFKSWIAGTLGPQAPLGDRPVQFTPEGEAFRMSVTVPVTQDGKPANLAVSALAKPLGDGRYEITGLRLPVPAQFTVMQPAPGDKAGAKVATSYNITAESQDGSGTWDTTYRTPSTLQMSLAGLRSETSASGLQGSSQIARGTTSTVVRPAGGDRVDVVSDSTLEGYTVTSRAEGTEQVQVSMRMARASTVLTGMSRERMVQGIQAVVQMVATSASVPTGQAAPPVNLAAMRALLGAMDGLASEFTLAQTWNDVAVSYGGMGGKAAQFTIGMNAKSPDGMLLGSMDLGLDGLALPDLPLGPMADLIPRRVALRPVVSNIATKDLLDLMRASTNTKDGNPPPEAVNKLFSRGGINTGLESFTVDVGGTVFAGNAKVQVASPSRVSGTGQITATNFDALVAKANAIPQMQQAGPVFLLVKGLARNEGGKLVWDVSYQNGRVLVNGQDMSAMMGGGRK